MSFSSPSVVKVVAAKNSGKAFIADINHRSFGAREICESSYLVFWMISAGLHAWPGMDGRIWSEMISEMMRLTSASLVSQVSLQERLDDGSSFHSEK